MRGRLALVTGALQGIGKAVALALAQNGCNVMLSGIEERAQARPVLDEVQSSAEGHVDYHRADFLQTDHLNDFVEAARARFGAPDILVNNAAVRSTAPIEEFPLGAWETALKVNLTAPFLLAKLVLPGMRARDWGRIINISSGFGLIGLPNREDYVTTKTGLIGMTRAIASETRRTGITCNAVCPGATLTPRQEKKIAELSRRDGISVEEAHRRLLRSMQVDRFVSAENIAAAVAFLCSEAGKDISGVAFPVDAGFTAGLAADLTGRDAGS